MQKSEAFPPVDLRLYLFFLSYLPLRLIICRTRGKVIHNCQHLYYIAASSRNHNLKGYLLNQDFCSVSRVNEFLHITLLF